MINPILIGERIYFRPLELSDIDNGWQAWINDKNTNEHLNGVYPVNKDELIEYYKNASPPNTVMFAICDKTDNQYIGNARLGSIDWLNRRCTYGRMIGIDKYRGKGYGTEALILLIKYGFLTLGMNRIYSGAIISNEASLKSNEKVGFVKEGVERQSLWKNGKFVDVIALAMTRDDYDKKYTI